MLRATFASFLLLHLVYFVKAFRPRCIVSSTRLRTSCKRHKCSLLFERIIPSFASVIKTEWQWETILMLYNYFRNERWKKRMSVTAKEGSQMQIRCSGQFFWLIRFILSNNWYISFSYTTFKYILINPRFINC